MLSCSSVSKCLRLLPLCKREVVVVRLVASGATPEGWFAATCKRSFLAFYCDINLNLKKCYQRSELVSIEHWRSEGIIWAGENARRSSADGPVLGVRPWPTQ